MSLPEIDELCRVIDSFPDDLCIVFPGGAELCAQLDSLPPSLYQSAIGMLGQANAALAPLQPIFSIIEAIVALVECVQAIPDALGPPPDPSGLIDCVPNLVEKLQALLKLLPQLSLPIMIKGFIDTIAAALGGAIGELEAILAMLERITTAKSIPNPALLAAIDCEEQSVAVELDNLRRSFGAVNSIIELINALGSAIGLPEIPTIGAIGDELEPVIDALRDIVDLLGDISDAIPLP